MEVSLIYVSEFVIFVLNFISSLRSYRIFAVDIKSLSISVPVALETRLKVPIIAVAVRSKWFFNKKLVKYVISMYSKMEMTFLE